MLRNLFYLLLSLFLFNFIYSFQYDPVLTSLSLNMSQAAYCVEGSDTFTCQTCDSVNNFESYSLKNGELILYGYNSLYNSVFIAFRGSHDIQNWIADIRFLKTYPYSNYIAVEKGFYNLFEKNKDIIYNNLNQLSQKYKTNNVIITGHSLGAALATVMSFDILYNDYPYNIYLTTFGSPRVGNQEFVNQFNKYKIYSKRVTHYYDMVPHLPQNDLNYHHVSQEIWFNPENSNYQECNDSNNNEDKYCSNSCAPLSCTSISDHLYYLNISMGSDGICF